MPVVDFKPIQPLTADICPPKSREHALPDAPAGKKMMAARNLLPLRPPEIVTTLAVLLFDADESVSQAALDSLHGLPDGLLTTALSAPLHAAVLDTCGRILLDRDEVMTALLTNEAVADETIAYLASQLSGGPLEIIGNNQVRYLRYTPIIEALYGNPATMASQIERVIEYAVRGGIMLSNIPDFARKAAEIRGDTSDEAYEEDETADFEGLSDDEYVAVLKHFGGFARTPDAERQHSKEKEAEPQEEEHVTGDMNAKIAKMNLTQKLRLAMLGDKSARGILIRSPLKSVSKMVLTNPKITLEEVALFSAAKSTSDDCLRIICGHREWPKSYTVAFALCNNPKAPLRAVMRMMSRLTDKDLRGMSRNRNLPATVQREARKVMEVRERRRS